jgi:probable HAF family extracellular repeat protein
MSWRIEASVMSWLIVGAGPALALTAGGCGEEFESCVASRTCPSAGKAGSGGNAGEAGAIEAPLGSGGRSGTGGAAGGTGNASGDGGASGDSGDSGNAGSRGTEGPGGSGNGDSGRGGEGGETVEPPDPCESVTCEHGVCTSLDGQGTCECDPGFAGPACELPAFEWIDLSGEGHVDELMLSGNGTVVGVSCQGDCVSRTQRLFGWTHEAGIFALGNAEIYGLRGVNRDASVVVGDWYEGVYLIRAFRWTEASGFVTLGVAPWADANSNVSAHAVSANGLVVVGASEGVPFRWTAGSGMLKLATPNGVPADSTMAASAVSDDGSIIAGTLSYSSTKHVLRWTAGGEVEWIEPSRSAYASGMSADGEVIVGSADLAGATEAFRWTRAEGMVSLGRPGGCSSTSSLAVSGDGRIILVSCTGTNGTRSYLWDVGGGFRSLEDVLESIGADVSAAGTHVVTGLSFDGRTILGDSGNPWLARLPAARD